MTVKVDQYKLDRSTVNLTDDDVARRWAKHFGKSIEEIANAIAKVENNAQTLKKELGCAPTD
jgi:chromosomal replication initiation ATPase DnaA